MEHQSTVYIKLERPQIFFDLETTGVKVQEDCIIKLSAIKIHPDKTQEKLHCILNPERPIPAAASAVHGFYDEDVKGKPRFCEVVDEICRFFYGL